MLARERYIPLIRHHTFGFGSRAAPFELFRAICVWARSNLARTTSVGELAGHAGWAPSTFARRKFSRRKSPPAFDSRGQLPHTEEDAASSMPVIPCSRL